MISAVTSSRSRITLLASVLAVVLSFAGNVAFAQSLRNIEDKLLGHVEQLKKASNYGGTSDYDVLSKENQALQNALIKYGKRQDVLKFSFSRLKEKMSVTTSKDGNFRVYSWDTEEGGTMHDFCSVFQFRSRSGNAHTWGAPYSQDMEDRGAGAFVHQIFQTYTKRDQIYLAVSTWIGSTSLAGQTITAYRISGERLDTNARVIRTSSGLVDSIGFEYDFFSVVDHPERPIKLFSYDDAHRSFRFPVVIADEKSPQGRVTDRFITYRFDGKYFVKAS